MLNNLQAVPSDSLLKLIGQFQADTRDDKIDLGVGVYRDQSGNTPVMAAVKEAEKVLVNQQLSKAYIGLAGDRDFLDVMGQLVFGDITPKKTQFAYLQTPGGSAAIRLASDFIRRCTPETTIWVGMPCWANHLPIFKAAGLDVKTYNYYDEVRREINETTIYESLSQAKRGDIILLQGCCHNPTGVDMNLDQWNHITALCTDNGLIPFIDIAYHGLGRGLKEDLLGVNLILEAVPLALVAISCSKNFGLYRERTGGLFVMTENSETANVSISNLFDLARTSYSMPPDHGASIVRIILETPEFKNMWEAELATMRERITSTRKNIIESFRDQTLSYMKNDQGMFSLLPLNTQQIDILRTEHSIYMAGNGRINIAGLKPGSVDRFVSAMKSVL